MVESQYFRHLELLHLKLRKGHNVDRKLSVLCETKGRLVHLELTLVLVKLKFGQQVPFQLLRHRLLV